MRFIANGPNIPDDLLNARDEGRVVFFCGAGVSKHRANLVDFAELTANVVRTLGALPDSPASKVLRASNDLSSATGVPGLVSPDRIFGLLEREFSAKDIRDCVSSAIRPANSVDLSAHQVLLRLARTPDARTQLVTTNFDRLFSDADPEARCWLAPNLPDLARPAELNGIVHLHGRAEKTYLSAEGDGYVLSTADYGRAYLAEGWAAQFIRHVINRYYIVFVGYSADDPPVHYLLEALNQGSIGLSGRMFAFQSGDEMSASGRWRHKGVEAIAYSSRPALWESLLAWSNRAASMQAWHEGVLSLAQSDPWELAAHERGQVAHLLTSTTGTNAFCSASPPVPASWLAVLDSGVRRARKERVETVEGKHETTAHRQLALDSDPALPRDPKQGAAASAQTTQVWDAFHYTKQDRLEFEGKALPSFRGLGPSNIDLPSRQRRLASWIARAAHEPACLWWAAQQDSVHRSFRAEIEFQIDRSASLTSELRASWQKVFDVWNAAHEDVENSWYLLKSRVDKHGWTSHTLRTYERLVQPRFAFQQSNVLPVLPPSRKDAAALKISLDVAYCSLLSDIEISDAQLDSVVPMVRAALQRSVAMEREVGGFGLSVRTPLVIKSSSDERFSDREGITGLLRHYVHLLKRLDRSKLRSEWMLWGPTSDPIFARLCIWVASQSRMCTGSEAGVILLGLSSSLFWDSYIQSDLVSALGARWKQIPTAHRHRLLKRISRGPQLYGDGRYRAARAVERLHWLRARKLSLSNEARIAYKSLLESYPELVPQDANAATRGMEMRGGWVRTDTDHQVLLGIPIRSVLRVAQENSGRTADFLVENNPWKGLCISQPFRAFTTLTHSGYRAENAWAWNTFLQETDSRGRDPQKLRMLIAKRLIRLPRNLQIEIVRASSGWLEGIATATFSSDHDAFEALVHRLLEALQGQPDAGRSGVLRGRDEPDWVMESINSPAGKIAQAIVHVIGADKARSSSSIRRDWLPLLESMLALPEESNRYAIVIYAYALGWMHSRYRKWTEESILKILDCSEDRQSIAAFWSGFLWGAGNRGWPSIDLFLQLKPKLLEIVRMEWVSRRSHSETLAGLLLAFWAYRKRVLISDIELRRILLDANEEFRGQFLGLFGRWRRENAASKRRWHPLIVRLLSNVWPRQIAVQSPSISARLAALVLEQPKKFGELVPLVTPLVGKIDRSGFVFHDLEKWGAPIVKNDFDKLVDLLWTILPDDAMTWPYVMDSVLPVLLAQKSAGRNRRLTELARRWNSR